MDSTTLSPAERVALLIKKLDVTTYQFGKATGISHQTLSNVLTGKNKPGLDTLQAIASVYPAAAIFLLTGIGEPFADGVRGSNAPATNPKLDSVAAPSTPAATEPARFTSGPETVEYVDSILLREQMQARIDGLEEDKSELRQEVRRLRDELGKPFNGLDAAGPLMPSTPRNPIGFGAHKAAPVLRLSVSNRVKQNGAARPLE